MKRIRSKVIFPIVDLDLGKYCFDKEMSHLAKYNLFAISFHHGEINYGHYTTISIENYTK